MQFAWIGRVDESQRAARLASLPGPLRLVIAQLHEQMLLLLTTFDPGADFDHSRRLELYMQRYQSWYQMAVDGPLVKRVLFLDLRAPKEEALSELLGASKMIKPAAWRGLSPVGRHIDKFGFKPGSSLNKKDLVTWMLYPKPLTAYRPIGRPEEIPGTTGNVATVTGYLILQLNPDSVRDRLVPRLLDDHLGNLAGGARPAVTITMDGESLFVYEPQDSGEGGGRAGATDVAGYSLRPPGADPVQSFDQSYPFLLLSGSIPDPPFRRGAIQQIVLRSPVDILRSIGPNGGAPGQPMDPGLDQVDPDKLFRTALTVSTGLPRLFLVSDRPHQLAIRPGSVGATLDETLNSAYMRSVAMGMLVLVLLVGSMAMAVVSGIRAARRAETHIEAVAFQSHHLRTPLAAITILADNLASGKLQFGDKAIEHAGLIRDYGQQLNDIVDRTVELTAAKSLQTRYSLTLVDVSAEAREALEAAEPIIRGAGFTSESSLAADLPLVWAAAAALRQCVDELLSNAIKYGLPGRWVWIETCEAGSGRKREVRIRIHDRGQGVPRQEARKIFDPYYRAAAAAGSSIRGSGLGLTLARCAVEEMGGKLTRENGEDGGSVFTIHLPVPA